MFWTLLLLIGAIAVILWMVRGRRPHPTPDTAYQPEPISTGWGRSSPPAPQPGMQPGMQQPGMGSQVMGGLATGLALGAGVAVAQEIGREMTGGHGHAQGAGSSFDGHQAGGSAADSPLARDAGLGSVGATGAAPWEAGGGWSDGASFDSDDGAGDAGGGDGGGD